MTNINKEKPLLIKNGHVIDPASNINKKMDILIKGDKIVTMSEEINSPFPEIGGGKGYELIDARGRIISPGLIDCHVHLREPGFEYKETIESGTRAAAKGGFTTVICEPNTKPPIDTPEMVDRLMKIGRSKAVVKLYTKVCMTHGSSGERVVDIETLSNKKGVVALSDDGNPIINDDITREVFSSARKAGLTASPHCEDSPQSLSNYSPRFSNPPYTNEPNYISRDISCAEETGVQLHISHVSLKESIEIIKRAKKRNLAKITCEATPHHLLLHKDFISHDGMPIIVNPPLRSKEDTEAIIEGLMDGTIDVIASDHAPHALEDKKEGAFGVIGLETTLGLVLSKIVKQGILSLKDAIAKLSFNPASIFGISGGRLSVGMPADITIIDTGDEWTVDVKRFESRSENCPFHDWRLIGRPCATIVGGEIIMMNGKLLREKGDG